MSRKSSRKIGIETNPWRNNGPNREKHRARMKHSVLVNDILRFLLSEWHFAALSILLGISTFPGDNERVCVNWTSNQSTISHCGETKVLTKR